MGNLDLKRRASNLGAYGPIPVTVVSVPTTQTAAFTACTPCFPPTELYRIRGFIIQATNIGTASPTIEVGMMSIASSNNIETTTILNSTGGAFTLGTLSSGVYYCRRIPNDRAADSALNAAPLNSGYVLASGNTVNTTTVAGTGFQSSTTYDFKLGAGGDVFSLGIGTATDPRTKGGTRTGYVPAIRVTQAANTRNLASPVTFTVLFDAVTPLVNV